MGLPVDFSIIIPFQNLSKDLEECLTCIKELSYKSFEVILLPDDAIVLPDIFSTMAVEIIATGKTGPAVKRDIGARRAKGKYLAFIDDDAYPEKTWLSIAKKFFETNNMVGAVGGPAVTPGSDPFWSRVSGAVFLSRISGGFPERYVPVYPAKIVDDWPSVNLIVKKKVFKEVGGFDSNYWPGEDTKFCRDIQLKGWKIYCLPDLIVYHHRRSSLIRHLKQIGNYGFHRGMFAVRYPENSRKIKYFIPAFFVLFLLTGSISSFFSTYAQILFTAGFSLYILAVFISLQDIIKHEKLFVALLSTPYIFLTHLWYGTRFIKGLCTLKYKGSLGR